jgi:hypothetical protein
MKTIKNHLQLFSIIILTVLFMNFASSVSLIGDFSRKSVAISTHEHISQSQMQEAAFPGVIVGVAAGIILAAAFVVGVVDGWNAGKNGQTMMHDGDADLKYHKMDFSKFDLL